MLSTFLCECMDAPYRSAGQAAFSPFFLFLSLLIDKSNSWQPRRGRATCQPKEGQLLCAYGWPMSRSWSYTRTASALFCRTWKEKTGRQDAATPPCPTGVAQERPAVTPECRSTLAHEPCRYSLEIFGRSIVWVWCKILPTRLSEAQAAFDSTQLLIS